MNNNTDSSASNTYTLNYFSKQLTEITVKTSIDLIRLSNIEWDCLQFIDIDLIGNGYKRKRDCSLKEGWYKRIRQYEKAQSKIDYIYGHRANTDDEEKRKINDIMVIHEPTKDVMELIDEILTDP